MLVAVIIVAVTVVVLLCCGRDVRHYYYLWLVLSDLGSFPIIADIITSKAVIDYIVVLRFI